MQGYHTIYRSCYSKEKNQSGREKASLYSKRRTHRYQILGIQGCKRGAQVWNRARRGISKTKEHRPQRSQPDGLACNNEDSPRRRPATGSLCCRVVEQGPPLTAFVVEHWRCCLYRTMGKPSFHSAHR